MADTENTTRNLKRVVLWITDDEIAKLRRLLREPPTSF
jgi:hypothetical protein